MQVLTYAIAQMSYVSVGLYTPRVLNMKFYYKKNNLIPTILIGPNNYCMDT
jgi:hypothetical protein